MPKISVIMPVYNAEPYLREAIDSILRQTFSDFEFIIIDDGSQDRSAEIVCSYTDPRIRFYRNAQNMGVAATLNRGLELAVGEYIARMDADDISLPERFARQSAFLDANPNIAVCATGIRLFGAQNATRYFSSSTDQLKVDLLFNSCFAHPSVCMRHSVATEFGGYDPAYNGLEDYELWYRISMKYDLSALPQILLCYRVHDAQVTQNPSPKSISCMRALKERQVKQLGLDPSSPESAAFYEIFGSAQPQIGKNLFLLSHFFESVVAANQIAGIYHEPLLISNFRSILIRLGLQFPRKYQKQLCATSNLVSFSNFIRSSLKQNIKHVLKR